jgi:hypothetical protein
MLVTNCDGGYGFIGAISDDTNRSFLLSSISQSGTNIWVRARFSTGISNPEDEARRRYEDVCIAEIRGTRILDAVCSVSQGEICG